MRRERLQKFLNSVLICAAIYPVVTIGVWGLMALGGLAADWHLPTDTKPLINGMIFAVLTVSLIDFLGVASVVMGLIAIANLIEYAQIVVPGRSASAVDFLSGMAGVVIAAILVWAARSFVQRMDGFSTSKRQLQIEAQS